MTADEATSTPGGSPAPTSPPPTLEGVEVIDEGVLPQRLRRPLDLARLLFALLLSLAVFLLAWLTEETDSGFQEDIGQATQRLPDLLILILNIVGGLGLLTLPVAAAVDLLARRRVRQLFDALLALFVTVSVLTGLSLLLEGPAPPAMLRALAGSSNPGDAPLLPLLGGLVAFITVTGLTSRRHWGTLSVLVVGSLFLVTLVTGGTTISGIGVSLLMGWAVGLAVRYALGTPTTRPSGQAVAALLVNSGIPLTRLQAAESIDLGRRYEATAADGRRLDVLVLDRDLEGAGLAAAVWDSLRFRSARSESHVNMRRSLDRHALMSYAAQVADVPAPRLALAAEVGPDAALLAYEHLPGIALARLPEEELLDADIRECFEALAQLQRARLAHRGISPWTVIRGADGHIHLRAIDRGTVAAGDVALRIDIAEMLATLSARAGPERTVSAAREVLGDASVQRALPVLQPVALNPQVRRELRQDNRILPRLRDLLTELTPGVEVEPIQLERIRPRTVAMVVLGAVAAYLLLSQLGQVDLVELVRNASPAWLALAALGSLITYPGAAWALSGFVPERLRLLPTMGAALAADFATLVSPPTVSTVAINVRYLQRNGIHPALATASIGVSQAAAMIVHVLLLLGFGVAAGTQADFSFEPPRSAVLAGVALLITLGAVLSVPRVRNWMWGRWGSYVKQIGPRLLTVAQQPKKMIEGVGGLVLLNLGYVFCLVASVKAFGGDLPVAAIGVVYLTGAVIGQAAPTPGGLGAVEAALAAGLTAAGLPSGLAVSSVLLFRLLTFWAPTVPGWFAMQAMQRRGLL